MLFGNQRVTAHRWALPKVPSSTPQLHLWISLDTAHTNPIYLSYSCSDNCTTGDGHETKYQSPSQSAPCPLCPCPHACTGVGRGSQLCARRGQRRRPSRIHAGHLAGPSHRASAGREARRRHRGGGRGRHRRHERGTHHQRGGRVRPCARGLGRHYLCLGHAVLVV